MNQTQEIFERKLDTLCQLSHFDHAQSIILIGSTARGEQSCFFYEDDLQCLSDIEAMVIFDNMPDAVQTNAIHSELAALEMTWSQRSPLFHIDILLISADRLSRFPRTVLVYEMKERGRVLRGKDLRTKLPDVSARNIDIGAVNELVLIRLWSLLLYTPRRILTGNATAFEQIMFKYLSCRNALEVLTILYPNLGVLLPSYRERVAYLEVVAKSSDYREYFHSNVTTFMQKALAAKLSPERLQNADSTALYRTTIDIYFSLLSFLLGKKLSMKDSNWEDDIQTSKLRLGDRRLIRRTAHELLQVMNVVKRTDVKSGMRWAFLSHRRLAICFLLHMHLALLSSVDREPDQALLHINSAYHFLSRLWPEAQVIPGSDNQGVVHQWLCLRKEFIPFMTHFYRFNRDKAAYFQAAHNWLDELQ